MASGKRLTIGVTVNLERFENLRVAVEGDVDTKEDADNLARYLDDVLAGFGKNDPEIEKQIANYRFRVLPGRKDATEEATPSEQEEIDAGSDAQSGMAVQSDTQIVGERGSDVCEPALQKPAESGLFCADCGASISKQENKLGHLFVDRPLCRVCLEALKKGQN